MRYLLIFFLIAIVHGRQTVRAQYYDTGQDPASLKWMQIKTSRFTIIYPEKYGSNGLTYAKALDEAYSKMGSLFPEKKIKIPVIIHNYTTHSNGYVAWAPKRMELYPTPEQNTIPLVSEDQLALHELTHVFQMESINSGFSKAISVFLGQQFTGAIAALIPVWVLEGDAVFAETALSESGRGRSPSFQKELKAIAVERDELYSYDKILNGSFRDYIPDNYQSGFQMATMAIIKKDPMLWSNVIKFTGEEPFTLNPVNISLRRIAGLTKKKLYRETFDSLKTIWTKDILQSKPINYETLSPLKNGKYISYDSPLYAGTDSIISIKTSLSAPSEFVLINPSQKTEKRIHVPGQVYPYVISYANHKLVWVETQSDPRWTNREYSVIKTMNINTNFVKKLSNRSRYLAAAISPAGNTIAAVENTINNINNLVLIDAVTGSVIQSVHSPDNVYLQHPQWSAAGEEITFIFLSEAGEGITVFKPSTQIWNTLIKADRNDLQSSFLRNDSLFFVSSLSGTDNIYLKTSDDQITEITKSKFGAIYISLNGGDLYFSDYSSHGNNICFSELASSPTGKEINTGASSFLIDRIEIKPPLSDNKPGSVYTPEPYRKWQHLFNFHSWMPFYADIEQIKSDPTALRPGISIMTQNQLSTLTSSIGYEYSAEKMNVFHARVTWKGWYPVIESQIDYGNIPLIYKNTGIGDPSTIQNGIRLINTIYLPLNFSSGSFSEYLQLSLISDYRNNYIYRNETHAYDYGQTIISGRVFFSNYRRSAIRDIYPRWAQTIDLNYSFAPFDRNIYGTSGTFKTSFYFPGILPNNGIKIRFEREQQVSDNFFMGNRVSLPRGYNNLFAKEVNFYSIDYVMPLVYPDFKVASLLYLKRIRTGLFYDYSSGPGSSFYEYTTNGLKPITNNSDVVSFRSFGIELLSDFHVLRIPYMVSAGVQSAWKSINEKPSISLLFNIDIYGMSIGRRRR
jgi:hypothetical protein